MTDYYVNPRHFLVFGGGSADLALIIRKFPNTTLFYIDVVNPFADVSLIKEIEAFNASIFNVSVRIVDITEPKYQSYDAVFSFSVVFRHLGQSSYKKSNQALKNLDINVDFPLYSDENHVLEFVKQILELYKYILNLLKVGGFAVVYPAAISFEIFGLLEGNNDFKVLDKVPEITFANLKRTRLPSLITCPTTFHVESNELYANDTLIASELLDSSKGKTLRDVSYSLQDIAPELVKYFKKRGIVIVPTKLSYACCIEKTKHVNYDVDLGELRKPFQLPTKTMDNNNMQAESLEIKEKRQGFIHTVKLGSRYMRSSYQIRTIFTQFDRRWASESSTNLDNQQSFF